MLRLALVLVLLGAGEATAQDPPAPPTASSRAREVQARNVRVGAGVLVPAHSDMRGFDAGPAAMLAVELPTRSRHLTVEAALGIARVTGREGVGVSSMDLSLLVVPVTLSLKLLIPPVGPIQPYLLAGIGYYYLDGRERGDGYSADLSALNSALGSAYGAGLAGRLSSSTLLGVDVRYHSAVTLEVFGDGSNINSVQMGAFLARGF